MKVLDLQCGIGHVFEGWFASEADFLGQCQKSLVQCPVCGDPSVVKKLSAPRLLLSGSRVANPEPRDPSVSRDSDIGNSALTDAWWALTRQMLAQTTDVGDKFSEEARKIHYGEQKSRSLRGTASLQEAQSLVDEGIDVVPFPMPLALKGRLQ